ncbi:MAG TPA: M20/M25/M40 family metallo-hydrolase [Gemmatimonadales bacterium]|nr:M20/M25/M40 family metallo-hydrolase [Gemmatimonadales bacterium]
MRNREVVFVLVLAAMSASFSASALGQSSPHRAVVDGITGDGIGRHIGVLAHDSLRGRPTPSRELDLAAAYVAAELTRAGVRPLAGTDLVTRWPLVDTRPKVEVIGLEVSSAGRTLRFRYGTEFAVMPGGHTPVTGTLVELPDLADTAAVRGRIPVIRLAPGPWSGPAHTAMAAARQAHARALVLVLDPSQTVGSVAAAGSKMNHASTGVPTMLVTPTAARRIRGAAGGATGDLTLTIPESTDTAYAPYVMGVIPGADPRLRHEYVALSAHLDHLGVGAPDERGDSIYNGADDNASGVAAVLEIARALAALRPALRRSVLFLILTGEEVGIRGSEWFTAHSPVPMKDVVADINLDGIGRSWQADTVSAEGSGFSTLGRTAREANGEHPDLGLTVVDDQWPDRTYFLTSDQIWFARRGVPSLFFSSSGPDTHYHRPSDEASTIETAFTARIARLAAYTALRVADAAERPRWDEAAQRKLRIE